MTLDQTPFVVVDTETTGSRAGDDRLIEVGAVRIVGGEVVGEFQQLIDPGRAVPQRITWLTGISTAMVFEQPSATDVMPRFAEFLGDAVMVAHNLPFDARFLDVAMDEAGLPPIRNASLDTLRLARRLLPSLPSKGLSGLTQHFGIQVHGRHRALGDAAATGELLGILLDRLRIEFQVETLDDLLGFQRKRYVETRREATHIARIRSERLPSLPDRPGVYFMRDGKGKVIYIGKAKSLKSRVRSYFTGVENHPPKTKKLLRDVRDVTWRETGTELSALLEESRLIKTYLPVYNRALRRYRDYPFLRLDTRHAYPTLSWTPRIAHDGAEYYGPMGRRGQAEELVELISRMFGLRECDDAVFNLGRPCLYHQMGRCSAPCAEDDGGVYGEQVARVRAFLTGQNGDALAVVEAAMREAAAAHEFESAGWYRDQLRRLERTIGRQQTVASAVHEHDAVLVEPLAAGYAGAAGGAQLFLIRHGRLATRVDLPVGQSAPVPEMTFTIGGDGLDADAPDRTDLGVVVPAHTVRPSGLAALRTALAETFDPALAPPESHLRPDVDEMRTLASWMRLHPDSGRQVRWNPAEDADAFLARVLSAADASVPDDAAPVEEEE